MPQTPVGTGNKYSVIIPSEQLAHLWLVPLLHLSSSSPRLRFRSLPAYNERKNLPIVIWLLVRVFEEKSVIRLASQRAQRPRPAERLSSHLFLLVPVALDLPRSSSQLAGL